MKAFILGAGLMYLTIAVMQLSPHRDAINRLVFVTAKSTPTPIPTPKPYIGEWMWKHHSALDITITPHTTPIPMGVIVERGSRQ